MKVGQKIAVTQACVITVLIVMAGLMISMIARIDGMSRRVTELNEQAAQSAQAATVGNAAMVAVTLTAVTGNVDYGESLWYDAKLVGTAQVGFFSKLSLSEDQKKLHERFRTTLDDVTERVEKKILPRLKANPAIDDEIKSWIDGLSNQAEVLTTAGIQMRNLLTEDAKKEGDAMSAAVRRSVWIGLVALIVGVILAILAGIVASRSIVRPLRHVVEMGNEMAVGRVRGKSTDVTSRDEVADVGRSFNSIAEFLSTMVDGLERVGRGDLTVSMTSHGADDEVASAFNAMIANLRELVREVGETATRVSGGVGQLAATSRSLSDGATKQAAALEELNASIVELNKQTADNAASSESARKAASEGQSNAEAGSRQLQTVVSAMDGLKDASGHIAKIVKVIDDIAFQTNLLALNAAVEAARAGSHGKGFAVVADEVRNLAGRSAKAAHEITELIASTVSKIDQGTVEVKRTSQSFDSIVAGASSVASNVGVISSATNTQATALNEITASLRQVDAVVHQTTASAEQTSAAAQELAARADALRTMVGRFRVE